MYFKDEADATVEQVGFSKSFQLLMVVNAIVLLVLGIHPDWLMLFL
jgi:formate hydrogenlyase subunit 3/multisubunit Na+/H+ antiporter MnhD subunit